jgi:hypothetical protein
MSSKSTTAGQRRNLNRRRQIQILTPQLDAGSCVGQPVVVVLGLWRGLRLIRDLSLNHIRRLPLQRSRRHSCINRQNAIAHPWRKARTVTLYMSVQVLTAAKVYDTTTCDPAVDIRATIESQATVPSNPDRSCAQASQLCVVEEESSVGIRNIPSTVLPTMG